MIFVDANVFMRFFVQPSTIHDRRMAEQARRLFAAARQRKVLLTTSDATLAEVAYILTSPRHYSVERPMVVTNIKTVLGLKGFQFAEKATLFQALDLWATNSGISFPDALAASYAQRHRYQVATFDERLAALPEVETFAFDELDA